MGFGKERGQSMTEYILIVALIALVAVAGVRMFGKKTNEGLSHAASKVEPETSHIK